MKYTVQTFAKMYGMTEASARQYLHRYGKKYRESGDIWKEGRSTYFNQTVADYFAGIRESNVSEAVREKRAEKIMMNESKLKIRSSADAWKEKSNAEKIDILYKRLEYSKKHIEALDSLLNDARKEIAMLRKKNEELEKDRVELLKIKRILLESEIEPEVLENLFNEFGE